MARNAVIQTGSLSLTISSWLLKNTLYSLTRIVMYSNMQMKGDRVWYFHGQDGVNPFKLHAKLVSHVSCNIASKKINDSICTNDHMNTEHRDTANINIANKLVLYTL